MVNIFLDLDRTLIYSYKRFVPKAELLVELTEEEPLAFMTKKSFYTLQYLIQREDVRVVVNSTRRPDQFQRLLLPKFQYAILSNGARLYVDNHENLEWRELSDEAFSAALPELKKTEKVMSTYTDQIKWCDNRFLRAKTGANESLADELKAKLQNSVVTVRPYGDFVSVFPVAFDKGRALREFNHRFPADKTIAAGDDVIDFPMADFADVFLTNNSECSASNAVFFDKPIFSDDMFDYITDTLAAV